MIFASAPGKLMLAGEYTVVDPGGPALAVAVGARVRVGVEEGGKRWRVTSEALGLAEAEVDEVPLLVALLRYTPKLPKGGAFLIQSELGDGPSKPGLGASAGIVVAAALALRKLAGQPPPKLADLIRIHRSGQGGLGSGYDVATSLAGGICLYDSLTCEAQAMAWPEGLHAAAIHCGHGSDTTKMLEKLRAWQVAKPKLVELRREAHAESAQNFIAAWLDGSVRWVLEAAAQTQEALWQFDRAGQLGITGGAHGEVLGAIGDAGAIARTAGAGGGDSAWALSDDPETLARAVAACEALGYQSLELAFGAPGAAVDGEPGPSAEAEAPAEARPAADPRAEG
jgi:phosphomevalonate kinase